MRILKNTTVLALATEAWGGHGGIAQSTRDLLCVFAAMPKIGSVEVLPRLQAEHSDALPQNVRQHVARAKRIIYAAHAIRIALVRRPQIVYCGHVYMAPLARLIAKITGSKLIMHVHGLEVWKPLSGQIKKSLVNADMVLCVSHHTASKVKSIGVSDAKCFVIFNTVRDYFIPGDRWAARARFNVPEEAIVISTVSRLDPGQRHKGHDRVIPLLAGLAAEMPGLTYLIAGDGNDRDRLEKLAKETGATKIVRFLGFVADADLSDLYRASNLYVMPSHGEGFGIAFVEAMCCGTPAIGLKIGGAEDALCDGELGIAVTEEAFPQAFRRALLSLQSNNDELASKARKKFGKPAFSTRVESLFSSTFDEPT